MDEWSTKLDLLYKVQHDLIDLVKKNNNTLDKEAFRVKAQDYLNGKITFECLLNE